MTIRGLFTMVVGQSLLLLLIHPLGFPSPLFVASLLKKHLQEQPKQIIAVILGLEGSVWLHLIKDCDPLPSEWKKSKRK